MVTGLTISRVCHHHLHAFVHALYTILSPPSPPPPPPPLPPLTQVGTESSSMLVVMCTVECGEKD